VFAFRTVARSEGKSSAWSIAGLIPTSCGFLIMTFYGIIIGWVVYYFVQSLLGNLHQIDAPGAIQLYDNLLASPLELIFWTTLAIGATAFVIGRGVQKGLEKTVFITAPLFILIMVALLVYAFVQGNFAEGAQFVFTPDFSHLTWKSVLIALGQAFFSLSIAQGSLIAYGAYLDDKAYIPKMAFIIVIADTAIAIIAGLIVFPIVFANGLEPAAGTSLVFKTLPLAFGQMPLGSMFAAIFFAMLFFAAFTSAIALLEPMVAFIMDACNWTRTKAAAIVGLVLWIVAMIPLLGLNYWQDIHVMGKNLFDFTDDFTANVMIPLGALLLCIFVGWVMTKRDCADGLQLNEASLGFSVWRLIVRFVAPILILVIFINAVGII
jgi:NSS family neurotransmitter:Na+ symporter